MTEKKTKKIAKNPNNTIEVKNKKEKNSDKEGLISLESRVHELETMHRVLADNIDFVHDQVYNCNNFEKKPWWKFW